MFGLDVARHLDADSTAGGDKRRGVRVLAVGVALRLGGLDGIAADLRQRDRKSVV